MARVFDPLSTIWALIPTIGKLKAKHLLEVLEAEASHAESHLLHPAVEDELVKILMLLAPGPLLIKCNGILLQRPIGIDFDHH